MAGLQTVAIAHQPALDPDGQLIREAISTQLFPFLRATKHLQNVAAIQLSDGSFVGPRGEKITPTTDHPITSVSINTLQAFANGTVHDINSIVPSSFPVIIAN